MLDSALLRDSAHPLVRAVLACEAGRRRAVQLGIVRNGCDHCVAHVRLPQPVVVRADTAAVVEAGSLPRVLSWRCAHKVCGLLLDALEAPWLRGGRVGEALQAAQLRLCPKRPDLLAAAGGHAAGYREVSCVPE